MILNHLEPQFQHLGLSADRPTLLLAIPFVQILSADRPLDPRELHATERFARGTLDFDSEKMRKLRAWLESPPDQEYLAKSLDLLEAVYWAPDVVAVERSLLEAVLLHCEKLLRRREADGQRANKQGFSRLKMTADRLGLDLGIPWQVIAPELFESEQQTLYRSTGESPDEQSSASDKEPPVRRWRSAARNEDNFPKERGGLV